MLFIEGVTSQPQPHLVLGSHFALHPCFFFPLLGIFHLQWSMCWKWVAFKLHVLIDLQHKIVSVQGCSMLIARIGGVES